MKMLKKSPAFSRDFAQRATVLRVVLGRIARCRAARTFMMRSRVAFCVGPAIKPRRSGRFYIVGLATGRPRLAVSVGRREAPSRPLVQFPKPCVGGSSPPGGAPQASTWWRDLRALPRYLRATYTAGR